MKHTMKATVVGGGIAGLCAAIALRNEGWHVTVFEKHGTLEAGIGNGLAIGANGQRLLEAWGIDLADLHASCFLQERVIDEETGDLVLRFDHSYIKGETGYDWLGIRRTRLYEALLKQARKTRSGCPAIQIHTDAAVEDVDVDSATIRTVKGEQIQSDVVVVAEGVFLNKSKLIYKIDPNAPPLLNTKTSFRMEVDLDSMEKDEELRAIWDNEDPGFVIFKCKDPDLAFFLPPKTDDVQFALVMHPYIEPKHGSEGRWDAEAHLSELMDVTQDTIGPVKQLVPLAKKLTRWTLSAREPVARFNNGKAAAIGDAAHPHIPTHGQGASAAMEDAASLAMFISSTKLGSLPIARRLKLWNSFRYARACTVQAISINHLNPLSACIDKIRNKIGYEGPLPENVNIHQRPVQMWLFNYDVRNEAEKYIDCNQNHGMLDERRDSAKASPPQPSFALMMP